jgi:hypothetical protein
MDSARRRGAFAFRDTIDQILISQLDRDVPHRQVSMSRSRRSVTEVTLLLKDPSARVVRRASNAPDSVFEVPPEKWTGVMQLVRLR